MPRPRLRHWFSSFSKFFHRRLQNPDQHQDLNWELDQDSVVLQDSDQHQELDLELEIDLLLDLDQFLEKGIVPDVDLDTGSAVFRIRFIYFSKTQTQTQI